MSVRNATLRVGGLPLLEKAEILFSGSIEVEKSGNELRFSKFESLKVEKSEKFLSHWPLESRKYKVAGKMTNFCTLGFSGARNSKMRFVLKNS